MSDTKAVATPESVLIQSSAMEQFMEKNFKKIIIGIVLVALAFVAFGVARYSKSQTELEAAEKFTSASTVEDCDVVIPPQQVVICEPIAFSLIYSICPNERDRRVD
jgi:heme/copper-type cytochrome/quinol oxidase subunit 2